MEAHTERNLFIVIGAVVIVAAGVFASFSWRRLLHPAPAPLPGLPAQEAAPPLSPQAKEQILQNSSATASSVSSDTAASADTPTERAQLLQSQSTASDQPPLSAEQKAQLLSQ